MHSVNPLPSSAILWSNIFRQPELLCDARLSAEIAALVRAPVSSGYNEHSQRLAKLRFQAFCQVIEKLKSGDLVALGRLDKITVDHTVISIAAVRLLKGAQQSEWRRDVVPIRDPAGSVYLDVHICKPGDVALGGTPVTLAESRALPMVGASSDHRQGKNAERWREIDDAIGQLSRRGIRLGDLSRKQLAGQVWDALGKGGAERGYDVATICRRYEKFKAARPCSPSKQPSDPQPRSTI